MVEDRRYVVEEAWFWGKKGKGTRWVMRDTFGRFRPRYFVTRERAAEAQAEATWHDTRFNPVDMRELWDAFAGLVEASRVDPTTTAHVIEAAREEGVSDKNIPPASLLRKWMKQLRRNRAA